MKILPIYDPEKKGRPMRVAAFMSGTGSNIIRLIEHEKKLHREAGGSPFEVVFIFSDRSDGSCQGEKIARENGIPYFSFDIRVYHRMRGLKRTVSTAQGLSARKDYDRVAGSLTEAFDIDVKALGGYMSFITLDRCINVHPGDLSLLDSSGKRKYVGDNAVLDAISAGESVLRSSTIWTDQGVDTGPLLMISQPLKVELPEPIEDLLKQGERLVRAAKEHQNRLKKMGDWIIFPLTVEMIARGRFSMDDKKCLYVDGKPMPRGFPAPHQSPR
jgi:folate-dependent phosphoribosylglycinamide formyltransferase PurN